MSGMTIIVKNAVRFISAAIMLFAAYIMLHGEKIPGGGYAGGIILASSLILITLAFGKKALGRSLTTKASLEIEAAAALVFLGYGTWAIFNWGTVYGDLVLGFAIAFAIYAAFLALVEHKIGTEKQ